MESVPGGVASYEFEVFKVFFRTYIYSSRSF